MKRRILYFICYCILLCFLFPICLYAHPGRTDSKGGHTNRETGEYHYHHGNPAHQHTDGICPYDFVDNEKIESNSLSKSNDYNALKSSRDSAVTISNTTFGWLIEIVYILAMVIFWIFIPSLVCIILSWIMKLIKFIFGIGK